MTYDTEVHLPNGRKKTVRTMVGGGHMTADQLAQQFIDVNAFPGAKALKIKESDIPASKLKSTIMAAEAARRMTPHPTIVHSGGERKANLRPEGSKRYAPGRVDYDQDGNPILKTATGGFQDQTQEPPSELESGGETAGNDSSTARNESDGSQGSAAPPQGSPPKRR